MLQNLLLNLPPQTVYEMQSAFLKGAMGLNLPQRPWCPPPGATPWGARGGRWRRPGCRSRKWSWTYWRTPTSTRNREGEKKVGKEGDNKRVRTKCVLVTMIIWLISRPRNWGSRLSVRQSRCVLTPDRVRHVMLWGNQIHSINLWTLGISKMYMRTLGYNV